MDEVANELENNESNSTNQICTTFTIDQLLANLQKHFSLFVLSTAEKNAIPAVVQSEVAEEAALLIKYVVHNYSNLVRFHLTQAGFKIDECDDLKDILDSEYLFDRVLSSVTGQDKIYSHCKTNLD